MCSVLNIIKLVEEPIDLGKADHVGYLACVMVTTRVKNFVKGSNFMHKLNVLTSSLYKDFMVWSQNLFLRLFPLKSLFNV